MEATAKTCAKCNVTKPMGDFYRNASKRDGRQSDCKACRKASQAVYQVGYRATSGCKAAKAKYEESEGGRSTRATRNARPEVMEAARVRSARRRASHEGRLREAARSEVRKAVGRGDMPRAARIPCEAGPEGCSGRHEWHHDSYLKSDWIKVRSLCRRHHALWHQDNAAVMPLGSG